MHIKLLVSFLAIPFLPFAQQQNLLQYAHPLFGTQKMGHVYPGATVPFGMVQLSPDTRLEGWDGCSGYHYSDSYIYGFTHTHLSGTGCSDYGDILLMPMNGEPSSDNKIYGSAFSHANEKATPGYYSVKLDDDNILAELTATARVGMHQYTFPQNNDAHIIFDLMSGVYNYEEKNVWTFVRVVNDTLVTGYRQTNGWGRTRTV